MEINQWIRWEDELHKHNLIHLSHYSSFTFVALNPFFSPLPLGDIHNLHIKSGSFCCLSYTIFSCIVQKNALISIINQVEVSEIFDISPISGDIENFLLPRITYIHEIEVVPTTLGLISNVSGNHNILIFSFERGTELPLSLFR